MFTFLTVPFVLIRALLRDPRDLAVENLVLRQQLAVLKRKRKRPRLRKGDRIFWVWLSRLWTGWRSVRRGCLDHVIVLNERHLRRITASYVEYHNQTRLHLSLERDAPVPRRRQAVTDGAIMAILQLGGLYRRYERCA